jgi:YVTN family beta-propeller protein
MHVLSSIATGHMPFTIALSPDRNTVYVANIGMFRYQVLPGQSGWRFRRSDFPSPETVAGVLRDGLAGGVKVPPLGDPNDRESNSVCVIDVHDPQKPAVDAMDSHRSGQSAATVANGAGQPIGIAVGGSAPSGILAVEDKVYVSNAHSDSITVISAGDNKVLGQIPFAFPGCCRCAAFCPRAWRTIPRRNGCTWPRPASTPWV